MNNIQWIWRWKKTESCIWKKSMNYRWNRMIVGGFAGICLAWTHKLWTIPHDISNNSRLKCLAVTIYRWRYIGSLDWRSQTIRKTMWKNQYHPIIHAATVIWKEKNMFCVKLFIDREKLLSFFIWFGWCGSIYHVN